MRALRAEEGGPAERPNFVVVLVDDMGYSDPGCYGGEIETPNLDRLAAEGVRFSEFYNCARCTPTRASLLTGAYAHRVGMKDFGQTMDTKAPTVAENLRDAGYATAMVGKWHLTALPRTENDAERIRWMNHELDLDIPFGELASYPLHRGFDRFWGIIWGVVNHFDPFSLTDGDEPVTEAPGEDFYMTDAVTDYAIDYLRDLSTDSKPFFLYVAYTAPHWPIHAPEETIAKYQNRYDEGWDKLREERFARQQEIGLFDQAVPLGDLSAGEGKWEEKSSKERRYLAEKMAVHAAMVDRVDVGLGRILEELRRSGEMDNTVILFMSDNGTSPEIPGPPGYDRYSGTRDGRGALREHELKKGDNIRKLGSDESYTGVGAPWASASNTPLRFWKAESYDGGCRTPLVVHWPSGLKTAPGSIVSDVGHVIDIAPTCYELAGVTPRSGTFADGVSLAPVLAGESLQGDRLLYFEHESGRGVRAGKWKASKRHGQDWELFDILADPGETSNLAGEHPQKLERLKNAWSSWAEQATTPQG